MSSEIGYLILIDKKTKEGYKHPVSQDYLIGSSVECNLKIVDERILNFHCRIKSVDNEIRLYSLDAESPVFLNDEPVVKEGKALKNCDKIRIIDDYEFEWSSTDRRIFSRSFPLPVKDDKLPENNSRYSDSALTGWKNVEKLVPVKEAIIPKTESVDESNVSVSCEINSGSVECENKIEPSTNTPVKYRKSKNPVSPFAVSNTYVSDSKSSTSRVSHCNDNDEVEFECAAKNIPEDTFEDSIMEHSTSQKPFHSTPKVILESKNRKNDSSTLFVARNLDDSLKFKSFHDTLEKNIEFDKKTSCKIYNHNDEMKVNSASKKNEAMLTKRTSEGCGENRRNTRGRTSLLRKTFEENSCDNENKSLTTPEKLIETNTIAHSSSQINSEDETITDANAESKYLNESSKSGFTSLSDENESCEGSFIDKYGICNVVRNVSTSKNPMVAKCARNLSYISPPENNRSQEYMDSMTTTPQKDSPSVHESITENYDVLLGSGDEVSMDRSLSSARKRRSTGFTPFVGTPSNEYRVTRKMSTPFSKSILSRTSIDSQNNTGTLRDGKYSSERRSTPYKIPMGKSSIRDSIPCQPTILESASFEELETSNHEHDSTNDFKFQYITTRRGRKCGESAFAAKNQILEESELKSDDSQLENDAHSGKVNTETSITNTSTLSVSCEDHSAYDKTATEMGKLKSILTPLPKFATWKEKSGKKVTFDLPNSPECTMNVDNSSMSDDESFAMISAVETGNDAAQSFNSDNVGSEEEGLPNQQDTDPSCNSLSELVDNSSVTYSAEGNYDESSLHVSGVQHFTKIQSNLNDLSGVQQMEPSPTKCDMGMETNTQDNNTVTDMFNVASISTFEESSNRSNVCEQDVIEMNNEVKSLKEFAQIIDNCPENSDSAKIDCSPGILLSGVKSLFNTPEKSRISFVNKEIKCNLNFASPSNKKTNIRHATEVDSSAVTKSVEAIKNTDNVIPFRMCKSLNLHEITTPKSETSQPKVVQVENLKITAKVSVSSVCNDELTSKQDEIKIVATDEITAASFELPAIMITEPSFVDENAIAEQTESITENQKEPVEPLNAVSSSSAVFENLNDEPELYEIEEEMIPHQNETLLSEGDNISGKLEASEFEKESVHHDDNTLSSKDDITDDGGSPILTQIRRSTLSKAHSDSKVSSFNNNIPPKEEKAFITTSILINERNTLSANVVSNTTDLLAHESNERKETEVDVVISDLDSSQLSNISSTEYMGDVDSMKISINSSTCNQSLLSDFSVKDTSGLDFGEKNDGDNNLHLSELSVNEVNNSDFSKKGVTENDATHSQSNKLMCAEDTASHMDSLENNINRKTKIVECLFAEVETQNDTYVVQKLENTVEMYDANQINASQNTSSLQDMGIRIDASSCLINDLHKELESTPEVSNPSNDESTPTETYKPVSFPESSNVSSIECASQCIPENLNKPVSIPFIKISDDVLTPNKTNFRGSSTPQSVIRRCRNSLRIHRCDTNESIREPCTSLHECSITSILDNSLTPSDAEAAQKSKDLQEEVVDEPNAKFVDGENVDNVQELLDENDTAEKMNKSVLLAESVPPINDISRAETSSPCSSNKIIPNVDVNGLLTEKDGETACLSEIENVESVRIHQEEPTDACEIIAEKSKVPIVDTSIEPSVNSSSPLLSTQTTDFKQINGSSSVETVSHVRRTMRTRKEQPVTPIEESLEQGVVTRNRLKRRPTLWYGKHFHCYLCSNSPENSNSRKYLRKTKQVERKLNEPHDDKENACSLLKVIGKLKEPELSGEQLAEAVSMTEKKTKKAPRRLKNLENLAVHVESEENIEDVSKRSCSIVLPILNPEFTKSPVKVDESGNISVSEDLPVATKKKRVIRKADSTETNLNLTVSRTRQKQLKTVTFQVEDEKSNKAPQPTDKKVLRSESYSSKRNLRNQTTTTEEEVAIEVNEPRRQFKTDRTIKIQLEALDHNAMLSDSEGVEKKTRAKRGTVALKNIENSNQSKNERKSKTQTSAKRAPENVEESIPKKRRGKAIVASEIPSKENKKSYDENLTKLPQKTRAQTKTSVQVEPVLLSNTKGRCTRSMKNKPSEGNTNDSNAGSKKRIRDADQPSVSNDTKKSNKKVKISKNTESNEPAKNATVKKNSKKTNLTKDDSASSIPHEEPMASSSKAVSSRITRNNKPVVLKKSNAAVKRTRISKNGNSTPDYDNLTNSNTVKESSAVEEGKKKRTVVTRSKNLSIKKGRISLTLKTSGGTSLVSQKSVKPSPAKVDLEDSSVGSRVRITRSRAK